jgi:predicted DNA-binding transcriptional regulator YafY
MSTNLHALLRYNIIDECLRDPDHIYHWRDLAARCYDQLIQIYPNYKIPSRRSIMGDIEQMRYGKLGYDAPIEWDRTEGFYYSNRKFSIKNIALSKEHLTDLDSALLVLQQLSGYYHLKGIAASIQTIRQLYKFSPKDTKEPLIYTESPVLTKAHNWIDDLYNYVKEHITLNIEYEPFERKYESFIFSPYFLKEYNNRWYIVGYHHELNTITNPALDRIKSIKKSLAPFAKEHCIHHNTYYRDVIGITKTKDKNPITVKFELNHTSSKYLETKPLHQSQQLLKQGKNTNLYSITVIDNYEMRSKLLGFGDAIKIISPVSLRKEFRAIGIELTRHHSQD